MEPNPGIDESLCSRFDCDEVCDWSGVSWTVGISRLRRAVVLALTRMELVELFVGLFVELLVEEPVELGV